MMTSGAIAIFVASHIISKQIPSGRSMLPIIGMIVCAVGFIGFATWHFWPKQKNYIQVSDEPKAGTPNEKEIASRTVVSHGQCSSIGTLATIQKDVALNYILPISLPTPGQPLYGLQKLQGATISPGPSKLPQIVYQCTITNYGHIPVLNARLLLNIDFQKPIEQPGGRFIGGELVSHVEWPVDISKIEPGESNPFVFCFYNVTPHFVLVRLGDSASFQRIDENDRRITTLVQPQYSPNFPILLLPFEKP
jgi:hypothetical protein